MFDNISAQSQSILFVEDVLLGEQRDLREILWIQNEAQALIITSDIMYLLGEAGDKSFFTFTSKH